MTFQDYLIGWFIYLLGALICLKIGWFLLRWVKSEQFSQFIKISLIAVLLAPGVSQEAPLAIAPANMVIIFQVLSKGEHLVEYGVLPMLVLMLLGLIAAVIDRWIGFGKTG